MPSYAIKSSGIRQVAANRLIGNSTGSTGSAQELSATDAKTLLGLGTTDSPQFAKIGIGTAASGSNDITFAPYASISVTGGIVINTDGNYRVGLNYAGRGIQAAKTLPIGWEDATNLGSAASDTKIYRDAAGVIAQRNGTNAQIFRIYNTDDGSQTNYGRASIGWDSNVFAIDVEASGTGAQGTFVIRRAGQSRISFPSNSSVTIHKSLYPSSNGSIYNGWSSLRWSNVYSVKSDISQTLTLASHTPATTTNKLYNVGGTLYFNGSAAGGNPFDQDLNTSDAPTFASATIGNMTLSDVGSYDSITSGDARLALRAQDGSMELYLENASDGNDSFRFNTNNGIFELFSDADNQIDLRNGTSANVLNVYNTYTDASNYQRLKIGWSSSVAIIGTENAGTSAAAGINFKIAGTTKLQISGTWINLKGSCKPDTDGTRWFGDSTKRWALGYWGGNTVTTSKPIFDGTQTNTASSGDIIGIQFAPTYNQTGTAGGTDILVNRIEQGVGSGEQNLLDLQVGGTSKFKVDNAGGVSMPNLPTSDPASAGELWNDSGTLKISAG